MESEEVIDCGSGSPEPLTPTPSPPPLSLSPLSLRVPLRPPDGFVHGNRRAKRPRITAPGAHSETAAIVSGARSKRLKRPVECVKPTSPNARTCAFCEIPGSVRECEGTLLGPLRGPPGSIGALAKSIYAHYNCAVWAPEVWEAPKTSKLQGVHNALARAKKAKCCLCGGKGASLACMFQDTACCRPMHFRCALRGGASLRAGYETFCPRHARRSRSGEGPPPTFELLMEKTPIEDKLLESGGGCVMCDKDSYCSSLGAILTCSVCLSRHHTRCMWPDLERDGAFAALSWQRKYLCKGCMRCVTCDRAIDKDVYNISNETITSIEQEAFNIPDSDLRDPECDTVKCLGCNHFAIHIDCLPVGSTPEAWRCDLCRTCKHCAAVDVPRSEWNEACEACAVCSDEIRNGGVVCPVCLKVYREGENIPMIQCDYCDKWLHANNCSGLTPEKFALMHGDESASESRYRCPICATEKKARDQERKRLKNGGRSLHINGHGQAAAKRALDLKLLLSSAAADEPEVAFHFVRKAFGEADNFEGALSQLSPDVEICRLCCSGGEQRDLVFCTDCGECYHEYCYESGAAMPFARPAKAYSSPAEALTTSRKRSSPDAPAGMRHWRCFRCLTFAKGAASSEGAPHADKFALPDAPSALSPERAKVTELMNGGNPLMHNGNGKVRPPSASPLSTGSVVCKGESIRWKDERKCELCEYPEGHNAMLGRLLPWASNVSSNTSDCWVHVACALWSVGISFFGSHKAHDVLSGPRRSVLHFAKRTFCDLCQKSGASLRCSSKGCPKSYHFECGSAAGVHCTVTFSNEVMERSFLSSPSRKLGNANLANLQSLSFVCPSHGALGDPGDKSILKLEEAHGLLNTQRVLRIFDTQGLSAHSERPKRKPLQADRLLSIRIGSLAVLRFGRLVPEVNDFIVNGCLVPIGYCAMRRFWSMVHAGRRCVYIFEVCGYSQSGPVFVIRCSDSFSERIESSDPDTAWSCVTKRLAELRRSAGLRQASHLSFRTSGLEAFGLANCVPVVTHVESLPMASMFAGRYNLKRVATHRSDEVIFYNSLARKFVPVTIRGNLTGSARTEGYAATQWMQKERGSQEAVSGGIPRYENARTGSAFQLAIAREVFSRDENRSRSSGYLDGKPKLPCAGETSQARSTYRSVASEPADRSRANKSTPSLPYATQHQCIASSSKSRTVILRSDIEGWGVFATKDIPLGEMIIEYVGEIIRPSISDLREPRYLEKGIGCYMFEIEHGVIVDATMCGNAARYINHSCAPNCYSKTIAVENDRKVVVIFAKRDIQRGEELSYDYQFPFDAADRVKCGCGTDMCKGYMN